MQKISIIVPVYNVEHLLSRCIDSVLQQTYRNWELLLVNDGSSDNSGMICDEYSCRDKRIRALHKPNGGVSSARNYGINNAEGEWITFIDSDDWVTPTYLMDFFIHGLLDKYTMYSSGVIYKFTHAEDWVKFSYPSSENLSLIDYNKIKRSRVLANGCPVAKLFNKELLDEHNIKFSHLFSLNEDHLFVISYLCHVHNVQLIRAINYNYWHDDGGQSLTSKTHPYKESLAASQAMFEQMSKLCDIKKCTVKDIVHTNDLQIFGAQQIVRAVLVAFNSGAAPDIYDECYRLAKLENIDYNDYTNSIRTILRLLLSKSYVLLRLYLTYYNSYILSRRWIASKLGGIEWLFNLYMYIKKKYNNGL